MTGLKAYSGSFHYKNVRVTCIDPSRRLGGELFYFVSPLSGRTVWATTPAKARKLIANCVGI